MVSCRGSLVVPRAKGWCPVSCLCWRRCCRVTTSGGTTPMEWENRLVRKAWAGKMGGSAGSLDFSLVLGIRFITQGRVIPLSFLESRLPDPGADSCNTEPVSWNRPAQQVGGGWLLALGTLGCCQFAREDTGFCCAELAHSSRVLNLVRPRAQCSWVLTCFPPGCFSFLPMKREEQMKWEQGCSQWNCTHTHTHTHTETFFMTFTKIMHVHRETGLLTS